RQRWKRVLASHGRVSSAAVAVGNLIGALGAMATACGSSSARCAGVRDVGLVLAVTDGETGEPICDATVHLAHADFAEDLVAEGPDPCRYLGGPVAGTYTVTISRDGYGSATATVEVSPDGGCGVETREFEVRLDPEDD
ncbi:MAG: hypothetical protein JW751_15530, partial [Polyangiaceae bacterium]|nr:hypothetical protein [Polyangiaceae bacterium]